MPTSTYTDREARLIEGNVRIFLEIKAAYDECDSDVQEVIDQMLVICTDENADEDQKRRAMNTILEALFPALAEDVLDSVKCVGQLPKSMEYEAELDRQEATFSERLKKAMEEHGITQEELAAKIGVGQSAVSNMLNRQCRPQTKTVERIAEALAMSPADLWPGYVKTEQTPS
jgi:lambda repressor-like predicted transcriptional regulator